MKTKFRVQFFLMLIISIFIITSCSDTAGGATNIDAFKDTEILAEHCQDNIDNDDDGKTDCEDDGCKGYVFCQEVIKTENTAVDCNDQNDNDDDGKTDCDDEDCKGFVFCASKVENTAVLCQDSLDTDDDGKTDCEDEDCLGFTFCATTEENTAIVCQDNRDNDDDGKIDCEDEGCQGFTFCTTQVENTAALCNDQTDNDNDNKIDCEDEDCQVFSFCIAGSENTSTACKDNQDNDGDNLTDCEDPDCDGFTFCTTEAKVENTAVLCQDELDNDNDVTTDCEDLDCQGFTFCDEVLENTAIECQDGDDNDDDGKVDCDDEDCQGFTFCLVETPVENTAVLCQDTYDNDTDGKVDCDDEDCQGFTFCGTFNTEDSSVKCEDGDDNDNDGKIDCDDEDCWQFSFCNTYNGQPTTDSWGDTWDSTERGKKTWQEADATCKDLGARLPTVTELYRNNSNLTGNLGESYQTNYLWTLISHYSVNTKMVVRLSDGNRTNYNHTTKLAFRCIWPNDDDGIFNKKSCYGAPEDECFSHDYYYNIDNYDRPPLPYTAAVNECNFYGASLLLMDEYSTAIHNGLPNGTNSWNWVHDYHHSNYLIGIKWSGIGTKNWAYFNGTYGTYLGDTSYYNFRCIGAEKVESFDYQKTNPVCYGGCFENKNRMSYIKSDSEDRDAETYSSAIETCRNLNGQVHSFREITENIHSGWDNGSNSWLWTSDIYGVYDVLAKWSGLGTDYFRIDSTYTGSTNSYKVRCVWHQEKPTLPTCTDSNDVLKWSGEAFVCEASSNGTASGNAYNNDEKIDSWGNAWDGSQRPGQYYADAKSDCESMGARLPSATELYKVNATTPIVANGSIGTTGQTGYLWTNIDTYENNKKIAMRISDGVTQRAFTTNASTSYKRPYRCIWPATKSDILNSINCNGQPGSECFETTSLVMDSYDRVALDYASAVNDCIADGGHIPDAGEYAMLIHNNLANGTDRWLWVSDGLAQSNLQILKWSGVGAATWPASTNRFSNSAHSTNRNFRCVYNKNLK